MRDRRDYRGRCGWSRAACQALWAWAQAPQSTVLPPPDTPFKGVIGTTYKDSVMDKIPIVSPPKGAPNVVIFLIDDAGFGQAGTFGGQIPTPTLDKLAQGGLRYTRYHTDGALLAHPGGAPHGPQPPLRRHGQHHGVGRQLPRTTRAPSPRAAPSSPRS